MADTPRLALPLLAAGQAQKHVTVNEALARLDALTSASAESRSRLAPPAHATEGALFIVPAGAEGAWAGRGGLLAARMNGGWIFGAPEVGRRLEIRDAAEAVIFDGEDWIPLGGTTRAGAATLFDVHVFEHVLGAGAGASSETEVVIPDKAVVFGVTARVIETLAGPGLTAWRLGADGASGRYGSGFGCAAGSTAEGVTNSPLAYFGGSRLLVEAVDGEFASGAIRFAIHFARLAPPR